MTILAPNRILSTINNKQITNEQQQFKSWICKLYRASVHNVPRLETDESD